MVSFRTCPRGSSTTWPPSTGALRVTLQALLSVSEGLCFSAPGEEWEGGVGHDGEGEGSEKCGKGRWERVEGVVEEGEGEVWKGRAGFERSGGRSGDEWTVAGENVKASEKETKCLYYRRCIHYMCVRTYVGAYLPLLPIC